MEKQNTPSELHQLLAIEQQHIKDSFRYVYYITKRSPNSDAPWLSDMRQYEYIEVRNRLCGSDQAYPNPYAQYDAWLEEHCGPDGHARVGSMVGFRDRGSAECFLRWIFPSSIDQDITLHLARMMMRVVPNDEIADKIFLQIGDDIISDLDARKLALLADRIFEFGDREEIEEQTSSESEYLALQISGLIPSPEQNIAKE